MIFQRYKWIFLFLFFDVTGTIADSTALFSHLTSSSLIISSSLPPIKSQLHLSTKSTTPSSPSVVFTKPLPPTVEPTPPIIPTSVLPTISPSNQNRINSTQPRISIETVSPYFPKDKTITTDKEALTTLVRPSKSDNHETIVATNSYLETPIISSSSVLLSSPTSGINNLPSKLVLMTPRVPQVPSSTIVSWDPSVEVSQSRPNLTPTPSTNVMLVTLTVDVMPTDTSSGNEEVDFNITAFAALEKMEAVAEVRTTGDTNEPTCLCATRPEESVRCPCISGRSLAEIHTTPAHIECHLQTSNATSYIICRSRYNSTTLKPKIPFTCVCQLAMNSISGNPSAVNCNCSDIEPEETTVQPPSTTDLPDCNCMETKVHPAVHVIHNCTCNGSSHGNFLVHNILTASSTNSDGFSTSCRKFNVSDGLVMILVNCSRETDDATTTTPTPPTVRPPSLVVNTSCPCEQMRLDGYDIVILHNCSCKMSSKSSVQTSPWKPPTSLNQRSSLVNVLQQCQCAEFELQNGAVIFRVNCSCSDSASTTVPQPIETTVTSTAVDQHIENCECEGVTDGNRRIIVCLNCSKMDTINDSPISTIPPPTTAPPSTIPPTSTVLPSDCSTCEEVSLFEGQVVVRINCSACLDRSKVFSYIDSGALSRQAVPRSDSLKCSCDGPSNCECDVRMIPCNCETSPFVNIDQVSRLFKRDANVSTPIVVCSCNVTDRRIRSTSTDNPSSTSGTGAKPETVTVTTTLDPSTSGSDSSTDDTPTQSSLEDEDDKKFWIRTVMKTSFGDLKRVVNMSELEHRLGRAYRVAFHWNHQVHVGLRSRVRRQSILPNVTAEIKSFGLYNADESETEVVYVIRSDGHLVLAKVAVEDANLLVEDDKMKEILGFRLVILAEEYLKENPPVSSGGTSASIIAIIVVIPLLLLFICLIAWCKWSTNKRKSLALLNQQQIFHESGVVHQHGEVKNQMAAPLIEQTDVSTRRSRARLESVFENESPPQLPARSHRQRSEKRHGKSVQKKKKIKKSDLESPPDVMITYPSESPDSQRSNDSLVQTRPKRKKNSRKYRDGRSPPLDVFRSDEGGLSDVREGVFRQVPLTPPTQYQPIAEKQKLKKELLPVQRITARHRAPARLHRLSVEELGSSGISSVDLSSNQDIAAISGSHNDQSSTFTRPPNPKPRTTRPPSVSVVDDEVDKAMTLRRNRTCPAEPLIEDIRKELERFHQSIDSWPESTRLD